MCNAKVCFYCNTAKKAMSNNSAEDPEGGNSGGSRKTGAANVSAADKLQKSAAGGQEISVNH